MSNYDFSVISENYGINSVEDAVKLLKSVKRIAFIGDPGLGKSYLSNLIEEALDKNEFVVRRIKSPKIDEIRAVIEDFKSDFSSQDKEKLLIIDEADNSSSEALNELKCYTDPENADNFIQIHVIYLKNEGSLPAALNSRTCKIIFEYPSIKSVAEFWKNSEIRSKLNEMQLKSISDSMTKLNKDKEKISHRDFGSCLKLMSTDPEMTMEIALRYKRNDIYDEKEFEAELKDVFKAMKTKNGAVIIDSLKTLKSEDKMNHLFSYIRSIAKNQSNEELYTRICNAQMEFLRMRWTASVYNAVDFNLNKYVVLFTCLRNAGVC